MSDENCISIDWQPDTGDETVIKFSKKYREMTEASKEAINALAEAGAIMFAPNNIWKAAELTAFGLEKRGYTIAPTVPVTDENLREAVEFLEVFIREKLENAGITTRVYLEQIGVMKSALSELAQRRAEEIACRKNVKEKSE